jgi:hypothetical protein
MKPFHLENLYLIKLQFITYGRVVNTQCSCVRPHSAIFLKRLRKTTLDLSQDTWYRWRDSKTELAASGVTPLTRTQTFLYPNNPKEAGKVFSIFRDPWPCFALSRFAIPSTSFQVVSNEISVTSCTALVCKIWMSGHFIILLQDPSVTVYEYHRLSAAHK